MNRLHPYRHARQLRTPPERPTRRRWLAALLIGLTATAASERMAASRPELVIEDPKRYWERSGFVEMVPPVALPTRTPADDRTAVWLRVPEGASIEVEEKDGRPLLRFPAGTEAARVESFRAKDGTFFVADVRGTRFLSHGREVFYVYRPDADWRGRLAGYAWPRGDAEREAAARAQLFRHVSASAAPRGQAEALRRFARSNECARCHVYARAANDRPFEHGEVNRGTDLSGLFLVQTVLGSEAPLETYQPHDGALDSPYVTVHCAGGPSFIVGQPARASCKDGSVPRARFDMQRALDAGDARAERVCAARRYLFSRMSDRALARFLGARRECEL
ncbi:MAG TPA: hypothetical protein VF989_13425 [Polyangiaceae bacterium]